MDKDVALKNDYSFLSLIFWRAQKGTAHPLVNEMLLYLAETHDVPVQFVVDQYLYELS